MTDIVASRLSSVTELSVQPTMWKGRRSEEDGGFASNNFSQNTWSPRLKELLPMGFSHRECFTKPMALALENKQSFRVFVTRVSGSSLAGARVRAHKISPTLFWNTLVKWPNPPRQYGSSRKDLIMLLLSIK